MRPTQPDAAALRGVILVCTAAALWGTVGVAGSLTTGRAPVDPGLAGMTRTALGRRVLLIAAEAMRVPWAARALPLRLLATFAVAGAVFQTCLFAAFVQVGVTVTVAVTVCAPVALVAAGDAAWRRRLPDTGAAAAIAIASAGVVVALVGGAPPGGGAEAVEWRGVALLVAASLAFAVVAATARAMGAALHPLRAAGLGLAATAGLLGLVVAARSAAGLATLGALPARDLAILGYTGIAATGGAYLAFVIGLGLSRSAASGLAATLIEPGVAALLAALVLHERLAAPEVLGCTLMLAAMIVLFAAERRAARAP